VLEVAIRLSSLEEAIDDFIEGAIAAHGHDQRARLANRPARDLGGVTWTRCEDGVEVEAWGPRQFSDRWPAAANPARGCGGVDDQDRFSACSYRPPGVHVFRFAPKSTPCSVRYLPRASHPPGPAVTATHVMGRGGLSLHLMGTRRKLSESGQVM